MDNNLTSIPSAKNREYMKKLGVSKKIAEFLSSPDNTLKEFALLCVWSYGETGEAREELASYGVVPQVIQLAKSSIQSIRLAATGSLWGFLEYGMKGCIGLQTNELQMMSKLMSWNKV